MTLRDALLRFGRKALIVLPIVVGAVILAIVINWPEGPPEPPLPEATRSLRVIRVPELPVMPRVLGYGTARPGDVWTAVAEVKGRVIEVDSELKSGAILHEGTVVLRIDPTEYDLQIARLQAEVAQINAQQKELAAQEANFAESLEIEQESLKLAERDLKRVEDLRSANAVAEASYDESLRAVLTQRQVVQTLKNSLNVLPSQRDALDAGLLAKEAGLADAWVDGERTVLIAPFDCRLGKVALEVGQYLTTGQVLFEAYGVAVTEVEAQVPIDQVRRLLAPRDEAVVLSGDPMETIRAIFDVEAIVRMRSGDFDVQWKGRFDRIREELDLQTRTLQVVIAVDKPYEGVIPGKRPPLSPGMFCEVELRGNERPNRIVVPRTSVRDGVVFLVDGVDDKYRLVRRMVEVDFSQGAMSVISKGLTAGEKLVVSDATPAVEGMLVEFEDAPEVVEQLERLAAGEGDLR